MLKKLFFVALCFITISSCKSTKKIQTKKQTTSRNDTSRTNSEPKDSNGEDNKTYTHSKSTTENNTSVLAEKIIETAKEYEGTRYKYGGTTKKGMDCSGLVTTVYNTENIKLPRTTGELSTTGDWVDLKEVKKGDLLFFATRRNSRTVNHVGIVTEARIGYVEFIHASTSAGVIISSLSEKYWYFAFVQARRIL
ncbi:MAG: C40 family peptidase [Flavobacteriaceae bacterium]|nr:C40 family peptidase [Mangrovimonas sp.]MCB0433894.1 C40 family peptidase [Mangrovimonas sp.]MCB0469202.1 C40 family peptidase [Flavobacteriaceae bacterium]